MRGKTFGRIAFALLLGTSPLAIEAAYAQAKPEAATTSPPVEETNRYRMRMMMQVFDGQREFAHTQVAGFARMRRGDESWVTVDFGDGAVVIDRPLAMQVGRFRNTSDVEAGFRYDYATKLLSGDSTVAFFHNRYVRPQLGKGPALGRDAAWVVPLSLGDLGFDGIAPLQVEISRRYISWQGKSLVLLHYRVPSFTYRTGGRVIVQWGEGAALTDPGFGQMYWNAALHRAVAQEGGASGRPYRVMKTMGAMDDRGRPLIDPRKVPEAAALMSRFYGASAKEVLAFSDTGTVDQAPVQLANKLDIMALSIGEDSANQLGEVTSAYTGGDRGSEQGQPYVDPRAQQAGSAVGARGSTIRGNGSTTQGSSPIDQINDQALGSQADRQAPANHNADAGNTLLYNDGPPSDPNRGAGGGGGQGGNRGGGGGSTGAFPAEVVRKLDELLGTRPSSGGGFPANISQTLDQLLSASKSPSGQLPPEVVRKIDELLTVRQSAGTGFPPEILQTLDRALESGSSSAGSSQADVANRIEDMINAAASTAGGGGGPASGDSASGGGSGGGGQASSLTPPSPGQVGDGIDTTDKVNSISEAIIEFAREGDQLASKLREAGRAFDQAYAALKAEPVGLRAGSAITEAQRLYDAQKAELATLDATFDSLSRTNVKPAPALVQHYADLSKAVAESGVKLSNMMADIRLYDEVPSVRAIEIAKNLKAKEGVIAEVTAQLAAYAEKAGGLSKAVKGLSESRFAELVKGFGDSPAGKLLGKVATALDVASTIEAVGKTGYVLTHDSSGGDLPLSRDYDTLGGSLFTIGFEVLAIAGDAFTLNEKNAIIGLAALTSSTVGDIAIVYKGSLDTQMKVNASKAETYRLEALAVRRDAEKKIAAYQQLIDDTNREVADAQGEIDNFDRDTAAAAERSRQLLEERRRAREEAERQRAAAAEAERQRAAELARAENERLYQQNLKRPPTPAEWDRFNRDIAEAMKPDYPTAPPPSPAQVAERLRRAALQRIAEARAAAEAAAAEAARIAAEEADRERRRQELADIQADAQRRRAADADERRRRNDEREKGGLDTTPVVFKPVTFKPPTWTPPKFNPPVWVPPTFTPPKASDIDWTNFDDDDYPGADGNLASQFLYGDMRGQVATDLSPWAEWLATQDLRKLERLALQAGYPNLASALADAQNILRLSQDQGYRRWALQAPSCGGLVGCGPSFLERWAMKSSIVALGDILNASRSIFSTAGLSDIGISGLNLSYVLRDFGVQDGDTINVTISQFGRTIFTNNNFVLTNAGNSFNINLRPGVASLQIFAVNEGTISPNTAEIKVGNVTQGEATQSYSLATGETATLRINTNAPRGN